MMGWVTFLRHFFKLRRCLVTKLSAFSNSLELRPSRCLAPCIMCFMAERTLLGYWPMHKVCRSLGWSRVTKWTWSQAGPLRPNLTFIIFRNNYTLPTCGLPLILCAYPWFKFWHFTHLWFPPLRLCYPPPLKGRLNMYFYIIFMSLSSQNIKHEKIQEKTRSKCAIGKKYYAIS